MKTALTTLIFLNLSFASYAQEGKASQIETMPSNMALYYFVDLKVNPNSPSYTKDELQKIQMDHMKNIGQMIKDKKLLLAGPFQKGGGLFILKVDSMDEAKKLVAKDPAVKAGRFKPEIRAWITEKGVFTLENL